MTKEIEVELEDGTKAKETVYTQDEVKALEKERDEAKAAAEDAKRVASEQKTNFKKVNEMSEEEKKAYDANTLELMQRSDRTEAENADLKKRIEEKEKRDYEDTRNSIAGQYHGGKEEVKTALEAAYASLAGMPSTSKEEIAKRYESAAKLIDIKVNSGPNPLYAPFSGDAPRGQKDNKEFVETPKGKEATEIAREALGIKDTTKK